MSGLLQKINCSEVDIGVQSLIMNKNVLKAVDFIYSYKLNDHTFMTHKPEYSLKFFGIFQCFKLSVWFTITFIFIATAHSGTKSIKRGQK